MDNLEGEENNNLAAVKEIQYKCQESFNLIEGYNSSHVHLATKQSIQYINKALFVIEVYFAAYNPNTKTSSENIKNICSPVHAGLETILNIYY